MRAVAETVAELIKAVKEGKDIDLNALKYQVSRKYNISRCVCKEHNKGSLLKLLSLALAETWGISKK